MGERSGPTARRPAPVASRVHRRGSLTAEAPHRPDGPLAPPAVARRPSSGLQSSSWTTRQGASVAPGHHLSGSGGVLGGALRRAARERYTGPGVSCNLNLLATDGRSLRVARVCRPFVTGQRGAALQAARRHLARHGPCTEPIPARGDRVCGHGPRPRTALRLGRCDGHAQRVAVEAAAVQVAWPQQDPLLRTPPYQHRVE